MPAVEVHAIRQRLAAMPRSEAVIVALCIVAISVWAVGMTVLILTTQASDYSVYRGLAPTVLDGRDLYSARLGPLAFTYPAFAALPLSLLAAVGFRLGLLILTAASLAAFARTMVLLSRAVVRERSIRVPFSSVVLKPSLLLLVFVAVGLWFAPVTKTLLNGQINLLLLWMVVEDVFGHVPPRWRGVLTGIATGIKLTPGLFIVTMLLTGRRVWALRAAVTFAATVAIGFAVEPTGSLRYWRHLGGGDGYGNPAGYGNQSVMYAIARMTGHGEYQRYLPVALVIVAIMLAVIRRLHARGYELATWGVTAIVMLAVTPVSWTHHWVWMMLPLAAMVVSLPTGRGRILLGSTVLVLWSGVVSLAPHLHLHGLGGAFGTEVIGNADLIVGLGLLAWFARLAWSQPSSTDQDADLERADTTHVDTDRELDLTEATLSVRGDAVAR